MEARALLLRGDVDGLDRLLHREPELVHGRVRSSDPPYDGYFNGATLLHHVAGNPLLAPLRREMPEVARLLLALDADVDASTRPGPSQPDDIGWTTLGLVASSAEARRASLQIELMDVLLDAGADPDAREGGCIMGALFYGETRAAEHLARHGARLDVIAAAGVGDLHRLETLLGRADLGPRLVHYSPVPWPSDGGRAEILATALGYAALHGRTEGLLCLLAAGADPNHQAPVNGRALHWAVLGDRPDSVRVLLDAGADPGVRDMDHGATPAEWAAHLGHASAGAALA